MATWDRFGVFGGLAALLACCGCAQSQAWFVQIPCAKTVPAQDGVLYEDYADKGFSFPLSRETAFAILLNTDDFATGLLGYFGSDVPNQWYAFQTMMRQPDANEAFRNLLLRARMAGRLYALCGLYFTDHSLFLEEVSRYRDSTEKVFLASGCTSGPETVGDLVYSRSPDAVHPAPGQTLADWFFERMYPESGLEVNPSFALDIAGGYYPQMFRYYPEGNPIAEAQARRPRLLEGLFGGDKGKE